MNAKAKAESGETKNRRHEGRQFSPIGQKIINHRDTNTGAPILGRMLVLSQRELLAGTERVAELEDFGQ
jgi:hypothetical protein